MDLFSEFPSVSKEAWLQRIAKELKDKPLDSLFWEPSPGWRIDPFGHIDDQPEPPAPLRAVSDWEMTEMVHADTPGEARTQALEALAGGMSGLAFHLPATWSPSLLPELLEGIHADFIGLHFDGPGMAQNPAAWLAQLVRLAADQGWSTGALRGSLLYDPLAAGGLQDWRYLAELLEFSASELPSFRCLGLEGVPLHTGVAGAPEELAGLMRRVNVYFEKLESRGISPATVAVQIQFQVSVGVEYFVELAKMRALRLLWHNVLQAWGIPVAEAEIFAHFDPAVYRDDLYTNMIAGTTMAMSAALGGATRLAVLPYDAGRRAAATYAPDFGQRIARNVHHLLRLESGFAGMPDAAAGSYYIENLTINLAERAWALVREKPIL